MDDTHQKLGILIETAETTQQLATALVQRLEQHTRGLDAIVRQEIRRTLIEELREVHTESQRAVDSLHRLEHAGRRRAAFWTLGLLACSTALSLAIAAWWLPSPSEMTKLTAQRADLLASLDVLKQHGARADLRTCGDHHLCVRVDPKAPRYGEQSDYFVVHGY